jgi:DnaK suppressor protein
MNQTIMEKFKSMFLEILSDEDIKNGKLLNYLEPSGDEIDQLQRQQELSLDTRLISRNSVFLKKVSYSLKKIELGSFGVCEECDSEIGYHRLLARPTATLCINCKEAEETVEKGTFNHNRTSLKNKTDSFVAKSSSRLGEKIETEMKSPNADWDFAEAVDF